MSLEVLVSSLRAGMKGETSSSPPGYLTPLLVAVPTQLDVGSWKHRCANRQWVWGCQRAHCHRRESRVSEWFSFQADILRDF